MSDQPFPDQLQRFGFSWDSIMTFGDGLMDWWSFYQTLVNAAPEGSTIVEVGCYHGQSLVCLGLFAKEANKGLEIIGVDDNTMGANEELKKNVAKAGLEGTVQILEMPSVKAASVAPAESCYCVFIDGGHLHDIVETDVRAWMPKIQPGGWLAGHDWLMYTVHQPVMQLFGGQIIWDERWRDIWIVPKRDVLDGVDIRVPYPDWPPKTRWTP